MSEVAIRVENLGKRYFLGHQKSGDLRQTFRQGIESITRKRSSKKEEFWALKDLNFEIKRGEVVGIIGRNGAGKSTLLKILSRITYPTTGRFEIDGRVSSLLEVGTGFHFELTGRENIFLNGTILGMRRSEIKSKFDEIVAFSGVENFLDTPVKHYSSGMRVRLAFSIAAHLEPEILIIDEVLAVGDAEFQKKCLGKMDEVSKKEGRTILFVSHNLAAVGKLCSRGILLRNGSLVADDSVDQVIQNYVNQTRSISGNGKLLNLDLRKGSGKFCVKEIKLLNEDSKELAVARTGSALIFNVEFDKTINGGLGSFRIDFAIDNEQDVRVGWFSSDAVASNLDSEFDVVSLKIPKFHLGSGTYYLTFYVTWNGDVVDYIHQGFSFNVEEGDFFGTGKTIPKSQTYVYADHQIFAASCL
jgi:ABC-type polysaccharide/polyol phosphate transport system, ATPase component